MKVTLTLTTNDEWRQFYDVDVDGKRVFSVGDGEPEDSNLSRDFRDVHKLPDLMRMAYEAGQRGEELTFEQEEVDET